LFTSPVKEKIKAILTGFKSAPTTTENGSSVSVIDLNGYYLGKGDILPLVGHIQPVSASGGLRSA